MPPAKGKEIGGGRGHEARVFGNAHTTAAAPWGTPRKNCPPTRVGFHASRAERAAAFDTTPLAAAWGCSLHTSVLNGNRNAGGF